jgi:hypothetical protein
MGSAAASFDRLSAIVPHDARLNRRLVVLIADEIGLPPLKTTEALERAGKCKKGSADWFRFNNGFTIEHAREALGDAGQPFPPKWIIRRIRTRKALPLTRRLRRIEVRSSRFYIDNSPCEWGDDS